VTRQRSAAIDGSSTVADVKDAFRRQGIELDVELRGSRWRALVRAVPGDDPMHEAASASSPDEAAREAWHRHVEQDGGTGAS
jgi:hypothetical protein